MGSAGNAPELAIVKPATLELVQLPLRVKNPESRQAAQEPKSGGRSVYMLSGLLFCSKCGAHFVMDSGTRCRCRRLIHCNITAHPSAAWTLLQLREAIGLQDQYEYLLHDRDCIFANHPGESIERLGVKVLKSPPHSPKANAICERVIDTIRRECLDWLIPLTESHLRSILESWVPHYNTGRPHMALGPGVPDPPGARERSLSFCA